MLSNPSPYTAKQSRKLHQKTSESFCSLFLSFCALFL
jgi:hypothetical protein